MVLFCVLLIGVGGCTSKAPFTSALAPASGANNYLSMYPAVGRVNCAWKRFNLKRATTHHQRPAQTPGLCRHQCIVRTACRSEPLAGGHGVCRGGDASVATSCMVHPSTGPPAPAAPEDPTPFCTLQGSGPQEPQAVAVAVAPFPDSP